MEILLVRAPHDCVVLLFIHHRDDGWKSVVIRSVPSVGAAQHSTAQNSKGVCPHLRSVLGSLLRSLSFPLSEVWLCAGRLGGPSVPPLRFRSEHPVLIPRHHHSQRPWNAEWHNSCRPPGTAAPGSRERTVAMMMASERWRICGCGPNRPPPRSCCCSCCSCRRRCCASTRRDAERVWRGGRPGSAKRAGAERPCPPGCPKRTRVAGRDSRGPVAGSVGV